MSETLGERLKYSLKIRNMKQKEFAERIGVTAVTLNRYIKGTRVPNAYTIADMCRELGVSSDWMLGLL